MTHQLTNEVDERIVQTIKDTYSLEVGIKRIDIPLSDPPYYYLVDLGVMRLLVQGLINEEDSAVIHEIASSVDRSTTLEKIIKVFFEEGQKHTNNSRLTTEYNTD